MDVKRSAVCEVNELMLAAAPYRGHALPFGALCRGARELPALGSVVGFETRERFPLDCSSKTRCCFVDFGEFGHT
jgi:hypothetical protein